LNLIGVREPEVYGTTTLSQIDERLRALGITYGLDVRCVQSNHEGVLIDTLHHAREWAAGAVFNPGAYAHYSYALRDAVAAAGFPVIEIHMSMVAAREPFRHTSVIAPACRAQVAGFGVESYLLGLEGLARLLEARR
jgi:3-dehydroquinate dehydratase-2